MTISIVSVAFGDEYRSFLPKWCDAVFSLETFPEEIIIATDSVLDCIDKTGQEYNSRIRFIEVQKNFKINPQFLVNEAISLTTSDWICKMDIDDIILPHALNNINNIDADIYMFGVQRSWENTPQFAGHTNSLGVFESDENIIFSCSPFRKWVWEKSPFRDMICEDWVFWFEAAKNEAKFFRSPTIDYVYVLHENNLTSKNNFENDVENARNLIRSLRNNFLSID